MYLDLGTLTALLLLLLLAAAAWFWNDSLRARDRVIATCARLCNEVGVQFLDQTVVLSGLKLQRGDSGSLEFARRYAFEFSGTGTDRWKGYALVSGARVEAVQLHGPEGVTILNSPSSSVNLPATPPARSSSRTGRDDDH